MAGDARPAGAAARGRGDAPARQIDVLRGHTDTVRGLAFDRAGATLASGGTDSRVVLWDVRAGSPLAGHERDNEQSPGVESVAFSPDGALLASGAHDRTVRLWRTADRTAAGGPLEGHGDEVRAVAFNRDGTVLAAAAGGSDPRIWLWEVASQRPLHPPLGGREGAGGGQGHTRSVRRVAFSPRDRDLLASASEDGTIRLWSATTGAPVGSPLTGHGDPAGGSRAVESVAFSPDGRALVSGGEDRTIRLWDVATREQLGEPLRGHTGRVWSVAFSPDGRTLASGSADRTLRLWDVATRQQRGEPLVGHAGEVRRVAFSPDGTVLASASTGGQDWTVWLWDVAGRLPLGQPLSGHSGEVWDLAFAGGGTLASASRDLTVRLWNVDLDLASWRRQVCGAVGRNLTPEEWRQYVGESAPRRTCPDLPVGDG